ncbi:MAG: hypothetical protein GC204_03555 [Chloroflexi bacterium]|nr:hypothetical protein [Chloroflexota bacterium]
MDEGSQAVTRFLEALQDFRTEFWKMRNELMRNGAKNATFTINLSGRPFGIDETGEFPHSFVGAVGLGIRVFPRVGEPVEFDISIKWNADSWSIESDIWVDDEQVNQRLLREFPQRQTSSLDKCLQYIADALNYFRNSKEYTDTTS